MAEPIFKYYFVNINNGNLYDTCFMTYEKAQERNEWVYKNGSKNIKYVLEYQMLAIHEQLGMIPKQGISEPSSFLF